MSQCCNIFRKARTSKGESRLQIGPGNIQLCVGANNIHDFTCIDSEFARQGPYFSREIDLERVEGVAGIFHHFRRANRGLENRSLENRIDLPERFCEPRLLRSYHGEWRAKEVADRCALADEF